MFLAAVQLTPAAIVVVFCLIFGGVFGFWVLLRGSEDRTSRARRRLGMGDAPVQEAASQESLLRHAAVSQLPVLNKSLQRLPIAERVQTFLDQADLSMPAGTFIGVIAGLFLFGLLVGWFIGRTPLYAVIFGLLLASLPYAGACMKRKARIKKFTAQFPDALELMSNSLRAGHAFTSALGLVAEEMTDPIASEFQRVFEEQTYGMPLEDALQGMMQRVDSLDLKFFAIAVMIQRETGGNMAEILDSIGHTIRERFKILGQVQTLTAQGRLSGWVLGFLPIGLGAALYLMNPDYLGILFTDPRGKLLLGFAGGLQITGFLLIRKIINIQV